MTNTINQADFLKQLIEQEQAIKQQIEQAREQAYSQAVEHVKEVMASHGITIGDLMGKKGVKVAPLYQDPTGTKTWSGRGRAPNWFREALELGHSRESLKIPQE